MSQNFGRTVVYIILAGIALLALFVVGIFVGRLFLQPVPEVTQETGMLKTAVVQTYEAQLTQTSRETSGQVIPTQTSAPVLPTATAIIPPTDTAVPTVTPLPPTATLVPPTATLVPPTATPLPPTSTPIPPTATPIPVLCDRALFVKDITYPDNTEVLVGSTFVKTWRLQNNGSCTWTSGYTLVFVSGDAMSGPASMQITTGTVPPGGKIDISVTLKAPNQAGTYRGEWKLRNAAGAVFGIGEFAEKSFWVQIKAFVPVTPTPTMTVAYDFIKQGPNAVWKNGTETLDWGDPGEDTQGVAAEATNRTLDNGKTYPRLLATFPEQITDGLIRGVYPTYTVKTGDHFRAILGMKDGCEVGKVRFIFSGKSGDTEVVRGEWIETCDGKVTLVDIDLTALAGQSIQFILIVKTEGSPNQDYAYWVSPRIER